MKRVLAPLVILAFMPVSALQAQDDSEFYVTGDVSLTTDYVYRGLTRSDRGLAGQASLSINHEEGFYAGIFASTMVSDAFENELFVGFGGSLGAYDYDLSASLDLFYGDDGPQENYFEVKGSLARDFGILYIKGGLAYAPDNRQFGSGESIYVYGDSEIPVPIPVGPPITLSLHLGYESFGAGVDKLDWSTGLFIEVFGFELGVTYHDADYYGVIPADGSVGPFKPDQFSFSIKRYF